MYPVALLRLEYVARVVVPAVTVSLSYAVLVVVSALSMCKVEREAGLAADGIVTDWESVSVCVEL